VVAVARKLAVLLHRLWVSGEVYVHPPCTERQSLNKECGWKGGDRGGLAQWEQFGKEEIKKKKEKKEKKRKNERKGLTLTGLLMEGLG